MKIKTSDLVRLQLDWAVAKCIGGTDFASDGISLGFKLNGQPKVLSKGWAPSMSFCPSTDWAQGGPIIEQEGITIIRVSGQYGTDEKGYCNNVRTPVWGAADGQHGTYSSFESERYGPQFEVYASDVTYGPTPLIAAMRCYVASKLGDLIEVPNEVV